MKKVLVSLVIGKRYQKMFDRHCRDLWKEYADKHGFDLILMPKPLDDSERAKGRSPAWQKCLILSQPELQHYDQAVWIDSDILINPLSPDITSDVPFERIGVVDEFSIPSKEEFHSMLERLYKHWDKKGDKYIASLTPTQYHNSFGLTGELNGVVQTGCMVLSPRHHKDLLEHVYYSYEDKGYSYWNYEMRPLSYEIQSHKLEYWITPKFNMVWPIVKQSFYPFLREQNSLQEKIQNKLNIKNDIARKCVTTTFLNNYFLHFSGGTTGDMRHLDKNIRSIFEI